MIPRGEVVWVQSVVGALAPVLSAVLLLLVARLGKRVEGAKTTATENSTQLSEVQQRLAEAEGAIRGDLKNGIKNKLDEISEKVDKNHQS